MSGRRKSQEATTMQSIQLAISKIGHCIFCRRKVTGSKLPSWDDHAAGDHLCEVPEAVMVSPNLVNTLNEIWPCMQKSWKKQLGSDELTLKNVLEMGHGPWNDSSKNALSLTFSQLPTMCHICGYKVQAVEDQMKTLRLQLRELRCIITESKKLGQGKLFERRMRSEAGNLVGEDVVISTLEFFNALGDSSDSDEEMKDESGGHASPPLMTGHTCQPEDTIDDEYPIDVPVSPAPSKNKVKQDSRLIVDTSSSSESDWIKEESSDEEHDDDLDFERDPLSINSEDDNKAPAFFTEDNPEKIIITRACTTGVNLVPDLHPIFKVERNPCIIISNVPAKKQKMMSSKNITSSSSSKGLTLCRFPCAVERCMDVFPNTDMWRTHMRQVHSIHESIHSSSVQHLLRKKLDRKQPSKEISIPDGVKERDIYPFLTCDLCGEKFPASKILVHMQGHIGDYTLKCPNQSCPNAYSTYRMFRKHIRQSKKCSASFVNESKFTSCEACDFKTDKRCVLRTHVYGFHERDPNKKFKCPLAFCDESFCLRQSVGFHLDGHQYLNTRFQKCEHCEQKIRAEEMEEHLKGEHGTEEIVKCRQCPFLFSSKASLVEHLVDHRHSGMYCDICNDNVKYTRHSKIREHYRVTHNVTGNQYVCEHCNKGFGSKPSWASHIHKQHSSKMDGTPKEKKRQRFPCDACSDDAKVFASDTALIAHKIRVHGDPPFSCSSCDATFALKAHLSRHEKEHGAVPVVNKIVFNCDVPGCEKTFTTKKALQQHAASIHLGVVKEKNFVCDGCGKSYFNQAQLKEHHDIVHLGLRAYVCDMCGERFVSGTVLKRHKPIHTGERPFACELCGQRFRHKEVLKRHLESHEKKGADFKPNGPMKQIRKRKAQ